MPKFHVTVGTPDGSKGDGFIVNTKTITAARAAADKYLAERRKTRPNDDWELLAVSRDLPEE